MISKEKKFEKTKAGLLLITSPRFWNYGEGLKRGSYRDRLNSTIEDDTIGKFHVLALVNGERAVIQLLTDPELGCRQNYLDVVLVPAGFGKYVIRNPGNQPVYIHKTMMKDGFVNEKK